MHPQAVQHFGDHNDAARRLGLYQVCPGRGRENYIANLSVATSEQPRSEVGQDARNPFSRGPHVEGVDGDDRHVPTTKGMRRSTMLSPTNSAIILSRLPIRQAPPISCAGHKWEDAA